MNPDNSFPFSNPMEYSYPAVPFSNSMDNSHPVLPFPNSMVYSHPALPFQNSVNYSYPALTNSEEPHPQPFSNTPVLPFPNSMDYSHPALPFQNSVNYSYPALTSSVEPHPQPFSNTPVLPFPNSMNYSHPALPFQNSVNYSYPALTNNEEPHPQPFSNTRLPVSNLGVGNGMSDVGHLGVGNGMSNGGQSDGSDVGQSGGSSVGQLSVGRPRGRPRGSKNKPKETALQKTSTVKSIVLEIPPGTEVIEWLKQYAQSRKIYMNVIGGSGFLSQATISHMPSEHPTMFSEKLCLLSFTGTVGEISPSEPSGSCSFSAAVARINGGIVGGTLRSVVSLGHVPVTALISKSPEVFGAGYATSA